MSLTKRHNLMLGALVVLGALVARDRWMADSQQIVAPVATTSRATTDKQRVAESQRPATTVDMPALKTRDHYGEVRGALFVGQPVKPPAPLTTAPPAPQPTAPPLPFNLVGRKLEDGHWEIYLTRNDKTYIAVPGAILDGTYKVMEIRPPQMTLVYLPLNETQTLAIGPSPDHE